MKKVKFHGFIGQGGIFAVCLKGNKNYLNFVFFLCSSTFKGNNKKYAKIYIKLI